MIDQLTIAIANYLKVLICIILRICIWACRPLVPHSFMGAETYGAADGSAAGAAMD